MEGCYLLHFEPAFKHARHYIGWSNDIGKRVHKHQNGLAKCAGLTRAAAAAGVVITLARTWPGRDRFFEESLKKRGSRADLCPICKSQGRVRRGTAYVRRKREQQHAEAET